MIRVLFVDDEPKILQGLERGLRAQRHEWQTAYVTSGADALDKLDKEKFDVIVSDMRMPTMNGAELLKIVAKDYPHMKRIILSGHSEQEFILKSIVSTHQYLSKPCEQDELVRAIARATDMLRLLESTGLNSVVAGVKSLPSVPENYQQMTKLLAKESVKLREVVSVIEKDTAMTAKILQIANSAFFGVRQEFVSIQKAVEMLGMDTIKTLVLAVEVFSQFKSSSPCVFDIQESVAHSMRVGSYARRLASMMEQTRNLMDDAMAAGLLHDVGKLVLATSVSEQFNNAFLRSELDKIPLFESERVELGATHSEVGAYLLGLWGLKDLVMEAVAYHHNPEALIDDGAGIAACVVGANVIDHRLQGRQLLGDEQEVLEAYFAKLNFVECYEQCFEQIHKERGHIVN